MNEKQIRVTIEDLATGDRETVEIADDYREYRECRTCGALETKVEWWRDWSGKTYWENPS